MGQKPFPFFIFIFLCINKQKNICLYTAQFNISQREMRIHMFHNGVFGPSPYHGSSGSGACDPVSCTFFFIFLVDMDFAPSFIFRGKKEKTVIFWVVNTKYCSKENKESMILYWDCKNFEISSLGCWASSSVLWWRLYLYMKFMPSKWWVILCQGFFEVSIFIIIFFFDKIIVNLCMWVVLYIVDSTFSNLSFLFYLFRVVCLFLFTSYWGKLHWWAFWKLESEEIFDIPMFILVVVVLLLILNMGISIWCTKFYALDFRSILLLNFIFWVSSSIWFWVAEFWESFFGGKQELLQILDVLISNCCIYNWFVFFSLKRFLIYSINAGVDWRVDL